MCETGLSWKKKGNSLYPLKWKERGLRSDRTLGIEERVLDINEERGEKDQVARKRSNCSKRRKANSSSMRSPLM